MMRLDEYFRRVTDDGNLAIALEYSFRFAINLYANPPIANIAPGTPVVFIPTYGLFGDTITPSARIEHRTLEVKGHRFGYKNAERYVYYDVYAAYDKAGDTMYIYTNKRQE
jgi:hypothetical protein